MICVVSNIVDTVALIHEETLAAPALKPIVARRLYLIAATLRAF